LRHQLLADSSVWAELLARHTLTLEPLIFLGHWVTPPYSPVVFHANYFAAWLPDGQQEELWSGELSDMIWLSPREALCGRQAGELFISYPVLETLRLLERHGGDLEAASAEAQTRGKLSPLGGELILGVHVVPLRTFTLPPATHTNCYVLGGHKEVVIVDPGSPIEAEQAKLEAFLDRLDVRVREIWLTHHHPDHVGGVARLRARTGAPVVAHAHTAEALAAEGIVERIVPDGEVSLLDLGGGAVAEWVALHTPGHARGHLCFYERTRALLLTGDNVVTLSTVIIAPPDGDMSIYMSSLARLRDLNARFLFPGHGPPSATPRAKIEEYIEHRQKREQAILEALDQPRTTSDIVRQVYSDIDQSLWSLAEVNVGAHLDKLAREGRVTSHGKTWVLAAS
jgi:glyoxylase-like metal-dependent hydrolase (beta-lactamase superfamily II)